jgi:beta-galactosidase/beta-glucuronidase
MRRDGWIDLCGTWSFCHDDADAGLDANWGLGKTPFLRKILVPFPPESKASGIGETGFHPVVWYSRAFARPLHSADERVILHFGAVDYFSRVWVNGHLVATHEGGHTPFSADITHALVPGETQTIVVRAADPPEDCRIPRGKQDWQQKPHAIWYNRTTGIWQPVWLSVVPVLHVTDLAFSTDLATANVRCEMRLSARPVVPVAVSVTLTHEGAVLARTLVTIDDDEAEFDIALPALRQTMSRERLLWSPIRPTLIAAEVIVGEPGTDSPPDRLHSYLGLRTVGVGHGCFLLNGRPTFLRMVLGQNYWPDSHLAASGGTLRREVELIREMGFNGVRIHQKIEDPRFLYWCDVLGVMVWEEMPSHYAFSASAVERLTREWTQVIRRDKGHPCIVAWVPFNESWGIGDIARRPDQASYARALYHLTKALDPGRPAISNDGWEMVDTDIVSIHDYAPTGRGLRMRYGNAEALATVLAGYGGPGRRLLGDDTDIAGRPVMLTEFGGLSFTPEAGDDWHGYATVPDLQTFEARLDDWFDAIAEIPYLMGYCYTQLTDTMQEVNGLLTCDRTPKLPMETLRRVLTKPAAAIPAEEVEAERRAARTRATGQADLS